MDASEQTVSDHLLAWYDAHGRTLPWRAPPGAPRVDTYRVWLSEVMLQQTTVAAVIPYYNKFTARWPNVHALAAADDADVMAAWAGLGYYARARNLLACARAVVERGGEFPDTEASLRALPGLGAYTAAAVTAIAFDKRAVVVDANVERVVARLFAIDEPLPSARKAIRKLADTISPFYRSGDFAQAMMDLGATICTARNPRCILCPLMQNCSAYRQSAPDRFPVRPVKRPKPYRTGRAYWIERNSNVWLVRRPDKGMLGGMRAFPDDGWSAAGDGDGVINSTLPIQGHWLPLGSITHTFTHFTLQLHLELYCGEGLDSFCPEKGEWWPIDQLDKAGLPTLFAKAAHLGISCEKGK